MENKNYMKEVASLLGVELEEEFRIIKPDGTDFGIFVITDEGIGRKIILNEEEGDSYLMDISSSTMTYLLTGTCKIEKLPFKPELGDWYWIPTVETDGKINVYSFVWEGIVYDYLAYHLGLCFRTKEEAEQNKDKLKEIIRNYESV